MSEWAGADDAALLAGLRAGDAGAFEFVLDAWSGGMIRVARSYVSTHESACDVVQETWVAVVRGIDRFEGRSTLKTWVYRILVNTAKRRGAQDARSIPVSSLTDDDHLGPTVDPALFRPRGEPFAGHWWDAPARWPAPEQAVLDGEIRAVIDAALQALPPRQRAVLTLRDVLGYESSEVCSILGISPENQRVSLHRGRASVRRELDSYFASVEPARTPTHREAPR